MVPAEEELGGVFRLAPVRDRVSIALMAFSGLRSWETVREATD